MSTASPSTDRWVVSTRVHGEVLTAEACISTLEIRLLGLPEGFSQPEAEGWIASLAASAVEGSAAAIPDDPLPPPLRQALGGLLFSHSELWRAQGPMCSVALMREQGRIACGWIGEAAVEIYVANERIAPEWIAVRDHIGGEARAWSGDAARETLVELTLGEDTSGEPLARLIAHWPGKAPNAPAAIPAVPEPMSVEERLEEVEEPVDEGVATEAAATLETIEPVARAEEAFPESEASARPSHGVARWLARTFGGAQETPPAPPPVTFPEPSREPARGPEPVAEGEVFDPAPIREAEGLPPEVPERIPPSPEPAALTARAVRESLPIDDPHTIQLPTPVAGQPRGAAETPPRPESESPPIGTPPVIEKAQWAATLEALGAREPLGMSPAIRDRIRRSRSGEAQEWEPLRIETLAPSGGWTGAETPVFPEEGARAPEPEPEAVESALAAPTKRGIPRRPDWPAASPTERPVAWGRWAIWTAFVLLLFGGGWMMGSFQNADSPDRKPSAFVLLLRQIGLGGARFDAQVGSHPPGARIAVDGKDTGLRTPSVLSLTPGQHRLDLSIPNLGSASFRVEGKKGDDVPVDAPLWGSVLVAATDPSVPVAVAIDGMPRGFVPATIDSLSPGPHELRFTGPGMASWGTAIEVRVGEQKEVLAYPLQSPATGLLQVRAMSNDEGDRQPLNGAKVWVDGRPRGFTPLTLELARGPHSVRVTHDKEEAPIQLIDLPGGNQRFASFEFGLVSDFPRIALRVPAQFSVEEPVLVSAAIAEMPAREIREMWLHVRSADGGWRRYAMTLLDAQGAAVGAAPFPAAVLAAEGSTLYYVSALTTQGDEIFTELQTAEAVKTAKPVTRR